MDQNGIDLINDKLYSLEVPHEPLKKMMFYFTVLSQVIDLPFPSNYLNYNHPYFQSYERMEEFLSLARALNPECLYQNNVIIFHNKKDIYKYYQTNRDRNDISYEFKVVDPKESLNPLYSKNYENPFNISNIDRKQTEFVLSLTNKVDFPHSEDSEVNTIEDHYLEEEDYGNKFYPDENYNKPYVYPSENEFEADEDSSNQQYKYPSQNNFEPDKNYDQPLVDNIDNDENNLQQCYQEIKEYFDESEIQKNAETTMQNFAYVNQMNSTDEFDESEEYELEPSSITNFYEKTVKIKCKLIVSKEWINFIYNEPVKDLLVNMKTVIKDEDIVRSKSIVLPKNIYFYLEILMLAILIGCSIVLFIYTISLQTDSRFLRYEGKNNSDSIFFPLSSKDNKIDYSNDTFIVPEKKKFKFILASSHLSMVSSIFGVIYFGFIIYMCIRVSREDKKEYKKRSMRNEAGLNMCHVVALIILTIIAVLIALIDEILTIVSLAMKTYVFIHFYVRIQLILNSVMFVSYFLIQFFYCWM